MRQSSMFRWWPPGVLLVTALSLLLVAGGSAAVPKAGKLYTGPLATSSYHGFTPSVSFTVSRNGRQLLGFKWVGGGCTGLGGPGNAYASPELNYKVGTINVSRTGSFSVKNVKTKVTISPGVTKTTLSTVKGRFKNATTATGTIYFTQTLTPNKPCSGRLAFTAILGPAPGALHKTGPANGATVKTAPTLRWTSSRNATSYKYCVTTSNSGTCNHWVSTHASTHATPSGLTAGTTYYWEVLASSVHGTVAADNGFFNRFTISGGAAKPKAGRWVATSFSGGNNANIIMSSIFFTVSSDQTNVVGFGYRYQYNGLPRPPTFSCSGSGSSTLDAQTPSPITDGQFSVPSTTVWTGDGSGHFRGTFDSATTAHGTADFERYISGPGCYSYLASTGTFKWTASWQSP
jgi:hypothetical protein